MDSTTNPNAQGFLAQHQLSPLDFQGDRRSRSLFAGAHRKQLKEIDQNYKDALHLYQDDSIPKAQRASKRAIADKAFQNDALEHSIQKTMDAYQRNPTVFDARLQDSRDASYALGRQPYGVAGVGVGALSGGVLGHGIASLAAKQRKVNPKFFGPLGGIAGAAAGLGVGALAGRKGNEMASGRRYSEVKTPYAIAEEMGR